MFVLKNRLFGEIQDDDNDDEGLQQQWRCLSMENIKLCGFFICDQSPTRLIDPCLIDLNTDDDVLTEFTENIESDGDKSNGFW